MNLYSRALRHIEMEDVKAKQDQRIIIEAQKRTRVRQAQETLKNWNSPEYSDWRNQQLKEGMTTGNVYFTSFPATGEASLETIDATVASSFSDAGGNAALNGSVIRSSGTGEGTDGGFDIGGNYLGFEGSEDSRWAILNPIDSSKFDTLVIKAIRGNDNNGGEDPDVAGEELRLYYLEPGGSSFRSISINPDGEQVLPADSDVIIGLGSDDSRLRDWSVQLPSYARGEGFTYMLFQLSHSGVGFDNYGVTDVRYQRRNPISLLVSLDSPEATSFISDGSGTMTPEQKKKRLDDMLAASDEYLETMFPTNQEAMRRAEENLKRNIEISLDPNTFNFPDYQTPEYYDMFPRSIGAQSSPTQIDRYLEQKGLTTATLSKDFNSQRGVFDSLGYDGTLLLLNNTDTQEQTLTAMGIDPGLLTNYTPDSYEKITKITNLRPGGTPATGWDGKFYEYNDPQLEASQVIPLETYLQVKGTDNYIGIEKPDRAEPGKRYVMEKKYSFTPDDESTPNYTGVRNKDIEDRFDSGRIGYKSLVGTDDYVGGHSWDYNLYKGSDPNLGNSKYMLRELAGSSTKSLNYIAQNADSLAYEFMRRFQNGEVGGNYKNVYDQYKDVDFSTNYDPLWIWNSDPTNNMQGMLKVLRGISSGRSLDSPVSYYTSNTASAESKATAERNHKENNDRLYENLQKALRLFDSPRSINQYEKDEWYLKGDDARTVTEIRTTHPYANLTTQNQQQPQPSEPDDPYMNIQVGDEQIIKKGDDTILDTLRGIDNRQKNSIEKEMDRIQKMPPAVKNELTRLLNVAGTSEYTPTPPKTKKEIEDYMASLPPGVIEDMEKGGKTLASGVDALGLGLAILAGLALGVAGVGAGLGTALGKGLSKIKNLTKAKPKPTKARYPTSPKKPTDPRFRIDEPLNPTGRNMGRPQPSRGRGMGDRWEGPLSNSFKPEGKLISEKSKDHNERIAKQGKLKSPSEFFKRADVKPVYPDTPPPEMVQGRHPDWWDGEKVSQRYNRLDPSSAKAMPNTGNPKIDAKIAKAKNKPK